jgi:hypothetical protein
MLVLHQLPCVLFTPWHFMHFLELTYWRDATVPVPVFCCFCVSEKLHRKYSQNWAKQSPKFLFSPNTRWSPNKSRRGARGDHTRGGAGGPLGAPPYVVGPLAALWHRPSAYKEPPMQKPWSSWRFSQKSSAALPPSKTNFGWYVQNISTFPNTFAVVSPLIFVFWIQLTRTNAVFSRIALVSCFCAEIQLSGKIPENTAKILFY